MKSLTACQYGNFNFFVSKHSLLMERCIWMLTLWILKFFIKWSIITSKVIRGYILYIYPHTKPFNSNQKSFVNLFSSRSRALVFILFLIYILMRFYYILFKFDIYPHSISTIKILTRRRYTNRYNTIDQKRRVIYYFSVFSQISRKS